MRLLGAHMSTAGGVDSALDRGKLLDCTAIQIFVKNNNQWFGKPLPEEEVKSFTAKREATGIFVFAHSGYLINLASAKPDNHAKSIQSMLEELEKCEELGIPFIVLHPGSHGGQGEEEGIKRVAHSLDRLFKDTAGYKVKIALETTAGQGTGLGYKFDHFKQWFELISEPARLGVCVDTCHIYAAGYDIATDEGYINTWSEFKTLVGFNNLMAFHLNDSKKELNSRVDRHEHIGHGMLGSKVFEKLLNDEIFAPLPMVLETPKDPEMKLDQMNLQLLRSLIT
jgi:deoxyribonuclease-4